MYETKTPEEYVQLLEQTVFEVDELMRCAQEEGDVDLELTGQAPLLREIRAGLVKLAQDLSSGEHEFGKGKELAFMEQVRAVKYLPFRPMFDALNNTYRKGFG